jgi:hypothetical protein
VGDVQLYLLLPASGTERYPNLPLTRFFDVVSPSYARHGLANVVRLELTEWSFKRQKGILFIGLVGFSALLLPTLGGALGCLVRFVSTTPPSCCHVVRTISSLASCAFARLGTQKGQRVAGVDYPVLTTHQFAA